MASTRHFFVGGNWKCNGTQDSVTKLVQGLNGVAIPSYVDVVIAPTALHLHLVQSHLTHSSISLSAQDCGDHENGAFTSSHTAEMLKDSGVKWVIVGHSERRSVFGDSNEVVASKGQRVLAQGLGLIACIGEKLEERESGNTMDVVLGQLKAFASRIEDWGKVVVAYEPVWAIGTGKVASPADAQAVHDGIRKWLNDNVSAEVGAATRIIYGGSVKPSNAGELGEQKDIDGFLVGGASLKADDFSGIITALPKEKNGVLFGKL